MNAVGIVDANRLSVADAVNPTPNMRSTIMGYFRALALGVIRQKVVDHETVEVVVPLATQGVIVPLSAKALELKPEGSRTWDWRDVYATPDLQLTTKDVIEIPRGGKLTRFVVMRAWDYTGEGFLRYEIVNDYT